MRDLWCIGRRKTNYWSLSLPDGPARIPPSSLGLLRWSFEIVVTRHSRATRVGIFRLFARKGGPSTATKISASCTSPVVGSTMTIFLPE